jgi:sec-independent protein translocase protein TatC
MRRRRAPKLGLDERPRRLRKDTRAVAISDPDAYEGREMHFLDHLEELRVRIIRGFLYIAVATGGSIYFCMKEATGDRGSGIINFVMHPAQEAVGEHGKFIFTQMLEPMMTTMKIGFLVGLAFCMPLLGAEIWGFVAPALTRREKRIGYVVVLICPVLFLMGAAFIYLVIPTAFKFLLQFTQLFPDATFMLNPNQYLNMMLTLMAGMGLVFQMPVVIAVLARLGIVSSAFLLRYWRHAIVLFVVLAAILTPTWDPLNLTITTVPMVFLYFGSILIAVIIERGNRKRDAAQRDRYEIFEPPLPPAAAPEYAERDASLAPETPAEGDPEGDVTPSAAESVIEGEVWQDTESDDPPVSPEPRGDALLEPGRGEERAEHSEPEGAPEPED